MAKKIKTSREQTFSFHAPDALSVQLVGDFTHWQKEPINLKRGPDGIWQTTVRLKPGKHNYRFLLNGQWQDDPACTIRVANPFGSQNMIREVA